MKLLYFVLTTIIIFLCVLLGGRKYRNTALYALAIGGVVNANFFHAGNYPINIFGLPFGIDSIIYTLFVFCVVYMFLKKGKSAAYLLAWSSIIAIVFSALMQLVADILSNGSSALAWTTFLGFMSSVVASVVAVIVMLEVLIKLKSKLNAYALIIIGTVIATLINTGIYYPLSILINGVPDNLGILLLTSLIGKAIAMAVSLFAYYLLSKVDDAYKTKKIK